MSGRRPGETLVVIGGSSGIGVAVELLGVISTPMFPLFAFRNCPRFGLICETFQGCVNEKLG